MLCADEVITEREPPAHKLWETIGEPRLLVVGSYRMGFDLRVRGDGSELEVFIDYELPKVGLGRWLPFLGRMYARWCTRRMARDAVTYFALTA